MKFISGIEINKYRFSGTQHELSEGIEVGEIRFIEEKDIPSRAANLKIVVRGKELDVATIRIVINLFCTYVRVWIIKP